MVSGVVFIHSIAPWMKGKDVSTHRVENKVCGEEYPPFYPFVTSFFLLSIVVRFKYKVQESVDREIEDDTVQSGPQLLEKIEQIIMLHTIYKL